MGSTSGEADSLNALFAVVQTFLFKEHLYQQALDREGADRGEGCLARRGQIARPCWHRRGGAGQGQGRQERAVPMRKRKEVQVVLSATTSEVTIMAKKAATNQPILPTNLAQPGQPTNGQSTSGVPEMRSNLDNCLKVLAGVQEQIRFADTKAAFLFGINTLMFGFVVIGVGTLKKALALTPIPASAWVGLVSLILFGLCAVAAVGMLIYTVMSRFGALAPKSRVFFGHIANGYGKDYGKYVAEVKGMTEDDWLSDVATQIVETSHIALTKHGTARNAAVVTIVGLVCWVVAVFCIALLLGS